MVQAQLLLQPRLQAIADLVPCGGRLADVGTDHAYLPVYLMQQNRIPWAIATDIHPEPLERGRRTARSCGMDTRISFRLCDGLTAVLPEEVDTVVMALVGYSGLFPTAQALRHGKKVALANKECLVVAGEIITRLSAEHHAPILPVDSEHSAIFQCLAGENTPIDKIILTASGGPFLHKSLEEMKQVGVEQALNHPNWHMGAKVTIDSASLMNKGFEVIEARWLFGLRPDQIDVVIHPGSIIHSMVQFQDGAIKAQIGTPDMHLPIQYALTFPQRLPLTGKRLDFCTLRRLEFFKPDTRRFPNLKLAFECLKTGGNAGAILNAANEVGVAAFLAEKIRFTEIARINEETLNRIPATHCKTLEEYEQTDREAREMASSLINSRINA